MALTSPALRVLPHFPRNPAPPSARNGISLPDQPAALFVGNNWKLKGLPEAIAALAACENKKLALMVVGKGNPEPFREQAAALGVANRLLFIGNGEGVADPRPLYAAADFLFLPTRKDTCSLVALEALTMGLAVITTKQNGAHEAFTDQTHGFVLDRGDTPALAATLNALCDPALRQKMSQAALTLRPSLSFDHHVSRIEGVYEAVRAASPAPATSL